MTARIWWNGQVVPFADATVHVTSETAQRGINVFEGMRAYWHGKRSCFAIVSIAEHFERLGQSLQLLSLPADSLLGPLRGALSEIIAATAGEEDLYMRPTIYLGHGSYTSARDECQFGAFVSCSPAQSSAEPLSCYISSYRRMPSDVFPARAKSGASYSIFRLARVEAFAAGYDEAILLDRRDNLTETGGASIFVLIGDSVATPALTGDILESITRQHALRILRERLNVEVCERSVSLAELLNAKEVFLTGTLDEVRPVNRVHGGRATLSCDLGRAVREEYLAICRGESEMLGEGMLTEVRPMADWAAAR